MIYTCTLNPSLDYYMEFNELELGTLNRCSEERYVPGGKGINVSIVLNNLRIPSRALGFLGGFTKDYFVQRLTTYEYVKPSFTYIEEPTRINVKIHAEKETTLNAKGPHISEAEKKQMLMRFKNMGSNDIFVLSGSIPDNCVDLVDQMLQQCVENQVQIVLDITPSVMRSFLKYKPLLIKPNLAEMEELFGEVIQSEKNIIDQAQRAIAEGAQNCIVTVGSDGAYFVSNEGAYHSSVVPGKVISTTGAGDSVVAGFLMNYLRSRDMLAIFKYASACGCATALSVGLATPEKVDEIVDQVQVKKVG